MRGIRIHKAVECTPSIEGVNNARITNEFMLKLTNKCEMV